MPTYDYVCDACEHAWEAFHAMSAKSIKKCPSCGKNKARRELGTGAGVIFKGSGFYETDYRSKSYTEAAAADKKSQTETKSEAKTESKSSGTADKPSGSGKKSAKAE